MVTWSEASSLAISKTMDLVQKHHIWLSSFKIGVVFRSEAAKSGGTTVWAKISKVDEKMRALMESEGTPAVELLIWIAQDVWNNLDDRQRDALIDHELCHAAPDGQGGVKLVGHDFEEFYVILKRYGLWNANLFRGATVFQQALLPLGLVDAGAVVAVQPELMPAEA